MVIYPMRFENIVQACGRDGQYKKEFKSLKKLQTQLLTSLFTSRYISVCRHRRLLGE
jgi:hypothetical protein